MSFLWLRGQTWFFRRAVPRRLRASIGKKEVRISLKTSDAAVAKRRAIAHAANVDRAFADAEAAIRESEAAAKNPAVRVYKMLQEDAEDRARRPRSPEDEEAELIAITNALEKGVPDPVEREVLETILTRLNGREKDEGDNRPLSIVFDRWRAERRPSAKTWLEWDGARRRFQESVGGDLPVRAITKGHVRAFKDALLASTSRRTGRPTSPATARKLLGALGSVLTWAVKQGYVDVNVAHGIADVAAKANPEDRQLPYDADDLKKLFSVSRKDGPDHWLPWLALWTGARLGELGQLLVNDIREEGDVHYLAIEPGQGKRLKTRSSRRRIPLHPELVRLGFLDYVETQRQTGHASLFPELRPTKYGSRTDVWSKFWGRHARELGVTDKRKTFHSFRHAFKDACRRAGLSEEIHDALTGHANGSVGRRYGLGVPLSVLAASLAKVTYPGLDLSSSR